MCGDCFSSTNHMRIFMNKKNMTVRVAHLRKNCQNSLHMIIISFFIVRSTGIQVLMNVLSVPVLYHRTMNQLNGRDYIPTLSMMMMMMMMKYLVEKETAILFFTFSIFFDLVYNDDDADDDDEEEGEDYESNRYPILVQSSNDPFDNFELQQQYNSDDLPMDEELNDEEEEYPSYYPEERSRYVRIDRNDFC